MSPIPRIARVPLTAKQPEACPHCGGRNLTRRGIRKKKLEIVQLWRCASCKRTVTPGPAALHNKTYPLRMILSALTDGCLQGAEVGMAFAGGEDQLAVEHRGLAADCRQRVRQEHQTLGPVATALAVEPHHAVILGNLEAATVEFRLMQPVIASRDGLGGRGDAGADEFRGHIQDGLPGNGAATNTNNAGLLRDMSPTPVVATACTPESGHEARSRRSETWCAQQGSSSSRRLVCISAGAHACAGRVCCCTGLRRRRFPRNYCAVGRGGRLAALLAPAGQTGLPDGRARGAGGIRSLLLFRPEHGADRAAWLEAQRPGQPSAAVA